jgi:hypothetical protein
MTRKTFTKDQAIRKHLVTEYSATREEMDRTLSTTYPVEQNDSCFTFGKMEFEVLTDKEATDKANANIADSLWAFKPEFIAQFAPVKDRQALAKALSIVQEKMCEDANELILAPIGSKANLRRFQKAAIAADGRAHFLNTYDDQEHEVREGSATFYIYRTN